MCVGIYMYMYICMYMYTYIYIYIYIYITGRHWRLPEVAVRRFTWVRPGLARNGQPTNKKSLMPRQSERREYISRRLA